MDSRTRESSIRTLKRLRDVYKSQLDTSVIVEIEAVIAALECDSNTDCVPPEYWGQQALRVIADVLQVVTNISDLMR